MSSLLHLTDQRRYHLYRKETDMRKGFDSLCGIIQNELGQQVMSGDAFIFINRPRTHLKLLVWERDGFTIVYRRLEKGAFEVPAFNLDQDSLQITSDQLHFIFKGIQLSSVKYRKRYQHKVANC
ncbi:MAG: IS66 family insertion sequence element accessory protein TnpB [Bacteroidota bacterium]|nr:IS66 family insertion sequence element accessory protein TnpB [Bacteroidota bacterium]